MDSFGDRFHQTSKGGAPRSTLTPGQSPAKTVTSETQSIEHDSPPLTPQDWIAAAKQGPRSRKERHHGLRIEHKPAERHHNILCQSAFHDDRSVGFYSIESENSWVPTLDMDSLGVLEQSVADLPQAPRPQHSPEPEQRRRISFRPPFFSRSSNTSRQLQSSPTASGFFDDDDDGAPSPIIPKTRTAGGASRRPMSQIITDSIDFQSSSLPITREGFEGCLGGPKALHQSFMDARVSTISAQSRSATVVARPVTAHSMDHKRRGSLGIFGWVKGVSGKRSEPTTPVVAEKFAESELQEQRTTSRLGHETEGLGLARPSSPDSFDPPVVRPRSEMTMRSDDTSRRPRYMGRRSRRG